MPNLQAEILGWVAGQPAITGAVLLAAGIVYAFFGFLFFRFLLVVTCTGLGWLGGAALAGFLTLPPLLVPAGAALALGVLAARYERAGMAIAAAATWGLFSYFLATQLRMPAPILWISAGTATGLGLLFAMICRQGTRVVLTALLGTGLMLAGFVGVTTHLMPAIGETFRRWAANQALVTPILLTMLFVTAYSYQSMRARGDVRTGG